MSLYLRHFGKQGASVTRNTKPLANEQKVKVGTTPFYELEMERVRSKSFLKSQAQAYSSLWVSDPHGEINFTNK